MSLTFVYLYWIIHILCHWWPWKFISIAFSVENFPMVSEDDKIDLSSVAVTDLKKSPCNYDFPERFVQQCDLHFFCIFSGPKLTPAGIPLPDALSENRQLSLQIMLISYPFNLSIVWYFSWKFAHMYPCGIHYQWLWPNCCKSNCFGDTDAIIWQAVGLMGLARGLQPAACINHQFTVASQAWGGDPQLSEHPHWLKSSMTPSWRRLSTENLNVRLHVHFF